MANKNNPFRNLPHIVRHACFYGPAPSWAPGWGLDGGSSIPAKDRFVRKNRYLDYKKWLKDLKNENVVKGLEYVLSKLNDFQGKIAIVGSSVGEKYPLGRDLDLALIGYGKEDALPFSENLYESFKKEYRENLNSINNGKKINFPAILYQCRVEDPFLVVSRKDEIIPGHGGINFELGIFSEETNSYKNMLKKNSEKLIIDMITDVSYENRGIKKNFDDWKTQMKKANLNYLVLDK